MMGNFQICPQKHENFPQTMFSEKIYLLRCKSTDCSFLKISILGNSRFRPEKREFPYKGNGVSYGEIKKWKLRETKVTVEEYSFYRHGNSYKGLYFFSGIRNAVYN